MRETGSSTKVRPIPAPGLEVTPPAARKARRSAGAFCLYRSATRRLITVAVPNAIVAIHCATTGLHLFKPCPQLGFLDIWFSRHDVQSSTGLELIGYQNGYQRPSGPTLDRVYSLVEVSEYLVGSPAFKPRPCWPPDSEKSRQTPASCQQPPGTVLSS